ncbi:MAG: phage holin family protein [Gammaproteobacteria bacterium]
MSLQDERPPVAASDASAPPPDFGEHAASLARELRGLVHDHLELATLETRLCIHNVLRMTVIAAFSALVLAAAWVALSGAAAFLLIDLGVAPATAMALLAAVNLSVAIGGWLLLRYTSARLGWPGMQRTLKPHPE